MWGSLGAPERGRGCVGGSETGDGSRERAGCPQAKGTGPGGGCRGQHKDRSRTKERRQADKGEGPGPARPPGAAPPPQPSPAEPTTHPPIADHGKGEGSAEPNPRVCVGRGREDGGHGPALTFFMAAAMSSYRSACSASRAFCTSCSRSTIFAGPGERARRLREEEKEEDEEEGRRREEEKEEGERAGGGSWRC